MPSFRVNIDRSSKAAILDANKTKAAGMRATVAMNELLAQETVNRVHQQLGKVLRHPTGYYQSRIAIERGTTQRRVSDSRVPYGGWLEGIDPRNRTTRFKGYHTFRLIRAQIKADKEQIIRPALTKYIQELQG